MKISGTKKKMPHHFFVMRQNLCVYGEEDSYLLNMSFMHAIELMTADAS